MTNEFYDPEKIERWDADLMEVAALYIRSEKETKIPKLVDKMVEWGYEEEAVGESIHGLIMYDRGNLEYDPDAQILRHANNWPFN